MTPLEEAVDEGHYKTVEYFIQDCSMDTSQFHAVCNINPMFVYVYSNVVRKSGIDCTVCNNIILLSVLLYQCTLLGQ